MRRNPTKRLFRFLGTGMFSLLSSGCVTRLLSGHLYRSKKIGSFIVSGIKVPWTGLGLLLHGSRLLSGLLRL